MKFHWVKCIFKKKILIEKTGVVLWIIKYQREFTYTDNLEEKDSTLIRCVFMRQTKSYC